jgi:signal recognition particle subunit SEC65
MNFPLYIIDFESSCSFAGGRHLPCEVAIVKYTLKDGEISYYHKFIDPGHIIL